MQFILTRSDCVGARAPPGNPTVTRLLKSTSTAAAFSRLRTTAQSLSPYSQPLALPPRPPPRAVPRAVPPGRPAGGCRRREDSRRLILPAANQARHRDRSHRSAFTWPHHANCPPCPATTPPARPPPADTRYPIPAARCTKPETRAVPLTGSIGTRARNKTHRSNKTHRRGRIRNGNACFWVLLGFSERKLADVFKSEL